MDTDLLLPSPAYEPYHEPYPLMDMATGPQYSQYPPQLPPHGIHLSQGPNGTAVGDPLAQKTMYDSPNPNQSLPLRNDSQPFLPPSPRRRRSRWRAIIGRSRRFARFTYATCLLIVLVIWGVINVVFTMRERDHQMVWHFDSWSLSLCSLLDVEIFPS